MKQKEGSWFEGAENDKNQSAIADSVSHGGKPEENQRWPDVLLPFSW